MSRNEVCKCTGIAIWICNGTGVHFRKIVKQGWKLMLEKFGSGGGASLVLLPHIAFAKSKGGGGARFWQGEANFLQVYIRTHFIHCSFHTANQGSEERAYKRHLPERPLLLYQLHWGQEIKNIGTDGTQPSWCRCLGAGTKLPCEQKM